MQTIQFYFISIDVVVSVDCMKVMFWNHGILCKINLIGEPYMWFVNMFRLCFMGLMLIKRN